MPSGTLRFVLRIRVLRVVGRGGRALVVHGLEDRLAVIEVAQAGDAALRGAGAEGHEDLRLAAEQAGHVLLLAVADAAVEEADVDLAVGHLLDVADLAVGDAGAEDQVEGGVDVEDLGVDLQDGDLATAARRGPVNGQLALGGLLFGSDLTHDYILPS